LDLFGFVCRQSVLGKLLDEPEEVLFRLFGYAEAVPAHNPEHLINRMLPVKEFPQVDAGRAQAETATGVRVKQNGPIVKLLPEYEVRIGYGFVAVFHHPEDLSNIRAGKGVNQAGESCL
jgi:hypothetical protein